MLKANVDEPTTAGRASGHRLREQLGPQRPRVPGPGRPTSPPPATRSSPTRRAASGPPAARSTPPARSTSRTSRTVIDWILANTSADPARIGSAGVSYGAGISLIASAFDPRIRAVAAMSGWTDLVDSLYGDQTRRPQAVELLKVAATCSGDPAPS